MATNMPMAGANAGMTDPNQQQDPSMQDDSQQGGFVVCIAVQADGSFQVYADDGDDSQDDSGSGGDSSDQPQMADNIDDALDMARQMIEQEMGEDGGGDQGPGNEAPDDAKKYWDQLASKKMSR